MPLMSFAVQTQNQSSRLAISQTDIEPVNLGRNAASEAFCGSHLSA